MQVIEVVRHLYKQAMDRIACTLINVGIQAASADQNLRVKDDVEGAMKDRTTKMAWSDVCWKQLDWVGRIIASYTDKLQLISKQYLM
jgi:hypothetical protein